MNLKDAKKSLRAIIAQRKQTITPAEKETLSLQALSNLEQLPLFETAEKILLYHALPDELQTASFLAKWESKKQLFLPVVKGENLLIKPYRKGETTTGSFGITEPTGECSVHPDTIDLAIIPGVAYNSNGARLGRGKGYYDRLLTHLSCPCIGICFELQLSEEIPVEPHDKPMDIIITPERIIHCKS